MLQYEELRLRLKNMEGDLTDLAGAIGLSQMQREVAELEQRAAADGFWDNMDNAQKITQRLALLNGKIGAYNKLCAQYNDTMTLIELADEPIQRAALTQYHLNGKTAEESAACINYSVSQFWRVLNEGYVAVAERWNEMEWNETH